MPTLYEASTEQGKVNLRKIALSLGMLDYNPERVHKSIALDAKLEDVEEIDLLMRQAPGFTND